MNLSKIRMGILKTHHFMKCHMCPLRAQDSCAFQVIIVSR